MHYGYLLFLFSIICYVNAIPEFYPERKHYAEEGRTIKPLLRIKRFLRLIKESDEEDALTNEESLGKHEEELLPVSEEEIEERNEELLREDQMIQSDQQELHRKKRYLRL